ncbi:alpha/beta fold hydrolase [Pseudalkalibacillus sp. R45]|uniref:alpha/beta fold hydrolase n=1 Tax=Pseudalkalibacillus sp. R45 TaxID=3457433 RepID=UPI003FCC9D88
MEDLKDTLDHLGVEQPHLVGCSLGGFVALAFAKKYKVRTLTISGIISDKPNNWAEELHAGDVAHQKALLNDPQAVAYFDNLHQSNWKQFIHMAENEDWYPFELTRDISDIHIPILVMVGEGNANEVSTASKYQQMNPNVHVSVIPFASHLVHAQKTEMYTQILDEFLSST